MIILLVLQFVGMIVAAWFWLGETLLDRAARLADPPDEYGN